MIDNEQRRVWALERDRIGLAEDELDLSRHDALAGLDEATVGVVLLPPDPLAPLLDFDDVMSTIPDQLTGQMRNGVSTLNVEWITGTFAAKAARDDYRAPARAVVGVARHGGAFAGVGATGTYTVGRDPQWQVRRLAALVGAIRVALQVQVAVHVRLGARACLPDGPWEVTIAAPGATGALLGGYAPGWQPVEEVDSPPLCRASNPIARLEIKRLPSDDAGMGGLLVQAMKRAVNIFSTVDPLYADARSVAAGVPRNF